MMWATSYSACTLRTTNVPLNGLPVLRLAKSWIKADFHHVPFLKLFAPQGLVFQMNVYFFSSKKFFLLRFQGKHRARFNCRGIIFNLLLQVGQLTA